MAFFEQSDLKDLYEEAKSEAYEWRRNYPEYERLADNGLLDDLDENLPEVNDGSLAAALFKLPKRVYDDKLTGRAKALDADDAWITELANIYWENKILPNANSQAPFDRKMKDVIRKAAIYGSQPVITLLLDHDDETTADVLVPYAQDVRLEPGKVSDLDSDIIFWDIYYSRKQVKDLIETAKRETEEDSDGYNKWDIKGLQKILDGKFEDEERDANEDHDDKRTKSVKKGGVKFCVAFQRGIKAPFYMYHKATNTTVREWENPDPTGDIPVKFLYCYQDFNNPYGIGIVRLAGGTQNVLDIMRQYDVLATQLGVRPPKIIAGNEDDIDWDSLVYETDANWYVGREGSINKFEMANGVYNQLPTRMGMYKTSLNQLIPTGDTSISAESGDPNYSKTPAGVKFQQASLSIDDEDFKDNFHTFLAQVIKNMINITFANMQGTDLMRLNDEERELLAKSGLDFPLDEEGVPTNELEIIWDEARATFDYEIDAEDSKAQDEEKRLSALVQLLELRASDPMLDQKLAQNGMRFNDGELISSIINLTTDNDKILQEVDPEEMEQMQMQEELMQQEQMAQPQEPQMQEADMAAINMEAVMAQYGVDANTAAEMLELEQEGMPIEEIQAGLQDKLRMEGMNA